MDTKTRDKKNNLINNLANLAIKISQANSILRFNTGLQIMYTGMVMAKYIDIIVRAHGYNRNKLDVLNALILRNGSLKPSELSEITFRSKQAITRIIDNLEKEGCVKRNIEKNDRRVRTVSITEKGLQSVTTFLDCIYEVRNPAVADMSVTELKMLNKLLRKARKELLLQISFINAHKANN